MRLEPLESERYIAELYADGKEVGRYKSVNDMSRKTGITEAPLRRIITAYYERKEKKFGSSTTYMDIDRTKDLKRIS